MVHFFEKTQANFDVLKSLIFYLVQSLSAEDDFQRDIDN